ncbi:CD302 antigen [Electrophorus electricus]|uniref:CD302 antigen n=1 Tax=Electrophorus electricus TaxID=8005 RepID=UPI000F09ED66|nr:CD302 antigen [Electrophorus electricus]
MEPSTCQLSCILYAFLFISSCFTQGQANGECPDDERMWVPFGQSCYHFVHGEEDVAKRYSIDQARDKCGGFGLLTVPNAQVNNFVVDYSLKQWKGNINIWLGMYYSSDVDEFKWNDETPLSYKNWEDGPNIEDLEMPLVDTCVMLHASSGKWENVSCSRQEENGVVCETAQKETKAGKNSNSPLLLALVVLSVVVILGLSLVFWFIQQRSSSGLFLLPSFEYHPPFRSPTADQTCLVEAEEFEEMS